MKIYRAKRVRSEIIQSLKQKNDQMWSKYLSIDVKSPEWISKKALEPISDCFIYQLLSVLNLKSCRFLDKKGLWSHYRLTCTQNIKATSELRNIGN